MSAILKVDVVCDIAMMSSPNILTTTLRDLLIVLYNQCIDNTFYSFFIYPTGQVFQVIRMWAQVQIKKSFQGSLLGITRLCGVMPVSDPKGQIFLSALNNHDRLFFLHTFWSPAFNLKVGVALTHYGDGSVFGNFYHYITLLCPFNLLIRFKFYNTV